MLMIAKVKTMIAPMIVMVVLQQVVTMKTMMTVVVVVAMIPSLTMQRETMLLHTTTMTIITLVVYHNAIQSSFVVDARRMQYQCSRSQSARSTATLRF